MKHKKPSTLQWCVASIVCSLVVLCASTNSIAYAGGWKTSAPENFIIIENSYLSREKDAPKRNLYVPMLEGKAGSHKISSGDMIVYDNNGLPWSFEQGQKTLCFLMEDKKFSKGQRVEFGFYCQNSKEIIFANQVKAGFTINFIVPKTGSYYFYVVNNSSDKILVKSFTLTK